MNIHFSYFDTNNKESWRMLVLKQCLETVLFETSFHECRFVRDNLLKLLFVFLFLISSMKHKINTTLVKRVYRNICHTLSSNKRRLYNNWKYLFQTKYYKLLNIHFYFRRKYTNCLLITNKHEDKHKPQHSSYC